MSVLRRLYNVAYGKVRTWHRGEGHRGEAHRGPSGELEAELRRAGHGVERPAGLRERWVPPATDDLARDSDPEREPAADEPATVAPRARRL